MARRKHNIGELPTWNDNLKSMIAGAPAMPDEIKDDLISIFARLISNGTAKLWSKYLVSGTRFFYKGYAILGKKQWLEEFSLLLQTSFLQKYANDIYKRYYNVWRDPDTGAVTDVFQEAFSSKEIQKIFEAAFLPEYKKSRHLYRYGVRVY